MWPDSTPEDLTEEVRRIFEELDQLGPLPHGRTSGSWTPPVDVLETQELLEIRCDLAGLSPETLRVLIKGSAVLIAGDKRRPPQPAVSAFHLVEREFGRFARVVRLGEAVDARRASAALTQGALTILLPKLIDRRGEEIFVAVHRAEEHS